MMDSLYIAATGMNAQQQNVDVIANNLANVSTLGFKKNRITFQDAIYQASSPIALADDQQSLGQVLLGMGTSVVSNTKQFTQGDLKLTQMPLDFAIQGAGFFEVMMPDGSSAYTRHGAFKVTSDGYLGTANGYELKQQIKIPVEATDIAVDTQGKITAHLSGEQKVTELGQLELVSFSNPMALDPKGDNLFVANTQAGEVTSGLPNENGLGTIAQGYLESSNVKLADEMVNLVLAQRAYELNAKIIQASDEMLSISNNLRK